MTDLPKELEETSGLVLYLNKYLITHNDGGNSNHIYILNLEGELLKTIEVDEAKNRDWEDLAVDKIGRLFIGDFGNNDNTHKKCRIYILRDDFIIDENNRVNAEKITFTYEDQKEFPPPADQMNYDTEAMIWMKGKIYLFTKCRSKPYTGKSAVYILPDEAGTYEAKKLGEISLCKWGWQFCSVTAADYHPETNQLVILTYTHLHLFSNFPGNRFWEGSISSHNLVGIKQREAICFKNKNEWYMTDEYKKGLGGGNLYHLKLKE
ncbi:MAG: hypothetical protein WDZ35_11630 [Crocinitomicaceae bacterium]